MRERIIINGYVRLFRPKHPNCDVNGYVAEHRLVMEEHLGRFLLPFPLEVVHHNKLAINTMDNRIECLELTTHTIHSTEHQREHLQDPDWCAKAFKATKDAGPKISKAQKERYKDPNVKAKHSEMMRKRWEDPTYKANMIQKLSNRL
jgi:hypothetical protein